MNQTSALGLFAKEIEPGNRLGEHVLRPPPAVIKPYNCFREIWRGAGKLGIFSGVASLLLLSVDGSRAEGEDARGLDGVEAFPYIEAIEVAPRGEFSDIRTIRTYKAGRGDTMLVSSVAFVVPWSWGENELKAFCRPTFKVTEGEVVEQEKDWWEEASRTNYPCVALGSKVMVNRKIFKVSANRGVITTVGTSRLPVRSGAVTLIPEEGDGERFVAVTLGKLEGAAISCGEGVDGGTAETGDGNLERRWKVTPGKEISIQTYSIQ